MSLIVCIETATDVCSVALARSGRMVSLRESSGGRDHARNVAVYVDEMLRETCTEPRELDAVAVSCGPGSYTGLRIGVSFAKGLCYALGIPLVAVKSLGSLASVAAEDHRAGIITAGNWDKVRLCPMIDARRMEVYTQVFDSAVNPLTGVSAEIITADSFAEFIVPGHELLIFGNGAAKCVGVLPSRGVRFAEVAPSARGLCREAQYKLDRGEAEDVAYFEPFYLKDFVVTTARKKIF